ncbi:MAG: response regulator [Clostridiales bacterium]|nr:response regulator [Clostridiales bacterium]MDD7387852.1 response regulator [Bacillota bacterium]MDY6041342.1 response regulator [Candidatus Faecousia sp.]
MYKAIIIDDEETVRTGLRQHFDWEMHGVTVVEEFPDCAKAYAYVQENPVDLVITDVITPYMDGITFAKKLQKEYPSIQIVFISGHADVQLLREALKSDAFDYILKSVDLEELSVTITRVVKLLDSRNKEKQRVMDMEDKLHELLPLHRERLLQTLLEGDYDAVCAPYLGLNLDTMAKYVCMVIRLTNKWHVCKNLTGTQRLTLGMECERHCNEAIADKPNSVSFKNRVSEYVVILKCESADYEQDVLEVSNRIQKALLDNLELETSIGISEPAMLSNFKDAYEEACEAIEQRYYLAENTSIAVKKYMEVDDLKAAREYAEKQLPEAILSGQTAQVDEVLNHSFACIRSMPQEEQENYTLFLLMLPVRTLPGLKAREDSPYRNQRRLVEHWLSCPSHVEQEQFIRQIMTDTTELLQQSNEPGTSSLVRQIMAIIDEQYMEQISVASLADQVHLTPTYLCVLFKQSTGKTINEYLTSERIRHAKELLRDPAVRLYDVCYQVGYLSPSYFSRLFKKQTGMPPGEYRFKALSDNPPKGNA